MLDKTTRKSNCSLSVTRVPNICEAISFLCENVLYMYTVLYGSVTIIGSNVRGNITIKYEHMAVLRLNPTLA